MSETEIQHSDGRRYLVEWNPSVLPPYVKIKAIYSEMGATLPADQFPEYLETLIQQHQKLFTA